MNMIDIDVSPALMEEQAENIWNCIWKWFYFPKTKLIYDFLTSDVEGRQFQFLPTADEVQRLFPNPCGWATGMEDSTINGGAMLSIICDRYAVTGENSLLDKAHDIFTGLYNCTMSHGVPGFVARSICQEDGKSVYSCSSRDQYTHLVHGFWKYYHSPLANEQDKTMIRKALAAVADYARKTVVPENNYYLLTRDGKMSHNVCQMWNLKEIAPHEAARLPMIYAAAWDVTGDEMYLVECKKYLLEGARFSCRLYYWPYLSYALLQMCCSLELLLSIFPEGEEAQLCRKAFCDAAERSQYNAMKAANEYRLGEDHLKVYPDWRSLPLFDTWGYMIPKYNFPFDQQTWRNAGESAMIQIMTPGFVFTDLQQMLFRRALCCRDYSFFTDYGPIYLLGAYWKMRRSHLI